MPLRSAGYSLFLAAYLFCSLPSLAQDKTGVCREGFGRMEGRWNGMKIVASPTQSADTIKMRSENCSQKDSLLQVIRYGDAIRNDSVRLVLLPEEKKVVLQNDAWIISLAVYDGDDIIIVLEQKGKENDKDCQFRLRYTISNNRYTLKKEARHFGEYDFSLREYIDLTKQE